MPEPRRSRLVVVALLLVAFATAGSAQTLAADLRALNLATFDKTWTLVNDTYFDPTFNGVDWDQVREQLRPRAESSANSTELRQVLQEMVDRLGQSHFQILPVGPYVGSADGSPKGLPNDKLPKGCAAKTQQLLAQLGIHSAPIPVEKVAKALGAQVRFSPFDKELSGMVYVKDEVPIIGVNSLHHPNRQRFTIAHELGHLQLHRQMIESKVHVDNKFPSLMRDSKSATGTERIEIQANQFAAELLMPRKLIKKALAGQQFDIDIDDDGPIEKLAKMFRVSKQALAYGIRNR